MAPDMNWSKTEIDHVNSTSSFDVSRDEEIGEAFNLINTQTLLMEVHKREGTIFIVLDL